MGELKQLRFLVAGAGSAGLGVSTMLVNGLVAQGLTEEEALSRFWVCDQHGLVGAGRASEEGADPAALRFARGDEAGELPDKASLEEVAAHAAPTVLLGLTAQPQIFTEALVRQMHANAKAERRRPIVFPLSNPTERCECTAEQAFEWTDGEAIFASGSPFDPVTNLKHGLDAFKPSQCNNMFIFPGIGLAASVGGLKKITDAQIYAAAEALAEAVPDEALRRGHVFPDVSDIRDVSFAVALGVIEQAEKEGLTTKIDEKARGDMRAHVLKKMYTPFYVPLVASGRPLCILYIQEIKPARRSVRWRVSAALDHGEIQFRPAY